MLRADKNMELMLLKWNKLRSETLSAWREVYRRDERVQLVSGNVR